MKQPMDNKRSLEKIYTFDFIITAAVIVLLTVMVLYACLQLFMM